MSLLRATWQKHFSGGDTLAGGGMGRRGPKHSPCLFLPHSCSLFSSPTTFLPALLCFQLFEQAFNEPQFYGREKVWKIRGHHSWQHPQTWV